MNYALIDNGVVTNVIYLHPRNASDFPNAVALNDVPATMGDTYSDGIFYRNGERVLTVAEMAQAEMAAMQAALEAATADAEAAEAAYNEGVQEA